MPKKPSKKKAIQVNQEHVYSLTYEGRQLCLALKNGLINPSNFSDKINSKNLGDTKMESSKPTEQSEITHCHFCKLQLFGLVYTCSMCNEIVHMACCFNWLTWRSKQKETLLCLKCGIPQNKKGNTKDSLKKDLLKRFLRTHFLDLKFQIQTSRMIRKITMEQLEQILDSYLRQINADGLDFFSYITTQFKGFHNTKQVMHLYLIRKVDGKCVLISDNTLASYNFSPFDFCLRKTGDGVYKFIPVYEVLAQTGKIHIINNKNSSTYYPKELNQAQINNSVITLLL
jgi:hypothetical protein